MNIKNQKVQLALSIARKYAKPIAICAISIFLTGLVSTVSLLASNGTGDVDPAKSPLALLLKDDETSLISGTYANTASASELDVQGNKIITSNGQEIILQSVNVVEMADGPDGVWNGVSSFTSQAQLSLNVLAQLKIMQSWGINTVRLLVNAQDWLNNVTSAIISGDPNTELVPYQTAVETVCQDAQSLGMYVDVCNYRLSDYWTNNQIATQDPLPFPPFATSINSGISSIADFVAFTQNEAEILKSYPNVMIELWNEPNTDISSIAQEDWFQAIDQSVSAMEAVGYTQPIIVQCEVDSWCTSSEDSAVMHTDMSSWLNALGLNDSNIIYGTHLYRSNSAFGTTTQGYSYSDVYNAMQTEGILQVAQNHPVFLSETGIDLDSDLANEITAEQNIFAISIANHISVGQHWFRDIGEFAMRDSNFNPTQGGQVFINTFANNPTGQYGSIDTNNHSVTSDNGENSNRNSTSTTTASSNSANTPTKISIVNIIAGFACWGFGAMVISLSVVTYKRNRRIA